MAKDPYQYFRIEARELLEGLTQGILDLEKGAVMGELTGRLLRQAHTLKGAARVVKRPKISELAHSLEGALAPYREGGVVIPKERITAMLSLLDEISTDLASLEPKAEAGNEAPRNASVASDSIETVRVDVGEMDKILEGLSEIGIRLGAMRRDAEAIDRASQLNGSLLDEIEHLGTLGNGHRGVAGARRVASITEEFRALLNGVKERLVGRVEQACAELAQVRGAANQLRLLP